MAPSVEAPDVQNLPLAKLIDILAPVTVAPGSAASRFVNWGLSYACTPSAVFEPTTEEQCALILELAGREGKSVRAVGVGHSPSDLACTTGFMVRMGRLDRVIQVLERHITVQAGITIEALHKVLYEHGLAMTNCSAISEQTLGGVVSTSTHGTGITYGTMSTQATRLKLMLADGSVVYCSRTEKPDIFYATLGGLGATGLILEITIAVEPMFWLKEVQEQRGFEDIMRNFDKVAHAAEHVRFWWYPQADMISISNANRTAEPNSSSYSWFWTVLVGKHLLELLYLITRFSPSFLIPLASFCAWLVPTRSVNVDRGYRIYPTFVPFRHYTTEWAIPYDRAPACLRELRAWLNKESADPHGVRTPAPIEVRFSAADDVWLSPAHGRATCWIAAVQQKPYGLSMPHRRLFRGFEKIARAHGGRPHWAKAHPLGPAELRGLYPRFDDFVRVLDEVDPQGRFRNPYIERHIFGSQELDADARVFEREPEDS